MGAQNNVHLRSAVWVECASTGPVSCRTNTYYLATLGGFFVLHSTRAYFYRHEHDPAEKEIILHSSWSTGHKRFGRLEVMGMEATLWQYWSIVLCAMPGFQPPSVHESRRNTFEPSHHGAVVLYVHISNLKIFDCMPRTTNASRSLSRVEQTCCLVTNFSTCAKQY